MSIFKTEVAPGIVTTTDSVVSAATTNHNPHLPGLKKEAEMDMQNLAKGAVRRQKSGDQSW